jgi:hypothetical protein
LKVNQRWVAPGDRVPVNWVLVHMTVPLSTYLDVGGLSSG